jgi:hypothetical protein
LALSIFNKATASEISTSHTFNGKHFKGLHNYCAVGHNIRYIITNDVVRNDIGKEFEPEE